jgi:hypothetical protein
MPPLSVNRQPFMRNLGAVGCCEDFFLYAVGRQRYLGRERDAATSEVAAGAPGRL